MPPQKLSPIKKGPRVIFPQYTMPQIRNAYFPHPKNMGAPAPGKNFLARIGYATNSVKFPRLTVFKLRIVFTNSRTIKRGPGIYNLFDGTLPIRDHQNVNMSEKAKRRS